MRLQGVAVLWVATLLAGCASTDSLGLGQIRTALHNRQAIAPTADTVAAKPFFQMLAISPDGRAVMVLGGVEGDLQGWYGHGGDGVFLDHGLVVRTVGLRLNLDNTHWQSGNPFERGLQGVGSGFEGIRIVDWSPGYRYGVAEHVRLVPAGMEDVNILGTLHHLRRVDEHVDSPEAGFTAENHYWVDPADGFIWKSHQVVAPGMPLDMVQLRPYRDRTP